MNGVVKDRGNSGEKRGEKQQPFVPPSSGAHDRHLGIRFSLSTVFRGGGITQITEAGSLKCQPLPRFHRFHIRPRDLRTIHSSALSPPSLAAVPTLLVASPKSLHPHRYHSGWSEGLEKCTCLPIGLPVSFLQPVLQNSNRTMLLVWSDAPAAPHCPLRGGGRVVKMADQVTQELASATPT